MVQNLVCAQNRLQATISFSHHQSVDEVEALKEEFHGLAIFVKEENKIDVQDRGPWHFDKKLILLKRFNGDHNPGYKGFACLQEFVEDKKNEEEEAEQV
uniref:Uncharacterized protein n=1 Tax=Quercus lobata TaxID=97700 RepID=A0A7N2LJ91_QUELO